MQRRLKKRVVYGLYGVAFCFMIGGLFFIESASNKSDFSSEEEDYQYVSRNIFEDIEIPVIATNDKINRPYTDETVKIAKGYYDYLADEESQKNSIIYYENTYMQSSGVSYGKEEQFDVVSILDGTVTEVTEDTTLGNSITIEHDNGIISIYQSITNISVAKGDQVKQGDIIANSSTSNISSDLGNHLYFELIVNGTTVNPENYYDKSIDEV